MRSWQSGLSAKDALHLDWLMRNTAYVIIYVYFTRKYCYPSIVIYLIYFN